VRRVATPGLCALETGFGARAQDSFASLEPISHRRNWYESAATKVDVMRIGYARPFSFQIGRRPETTVSSVRHGVTEITLSDGRLVRATLHVKSVKVDPTKPGAIDVSYNVIAEVMATPDTPICDVHETIQ
jgi:hypothetical protein